MEFLSAVLSAFLSTKDVTIIYNREACNYDKNLIVEVLSEKKLGFCKKNLSEFLTR